MVNYDKKLIEIFDKLKNHFHELIEEELIEDIEKELLMKIIGKIRQSLEHLKATNYNYPSITVDNKEYDWNHHGAKCLVCKTYGTLQGYTDIVSEKDEQGNPYPVLIFWPESFECNTCGLILESYDELVYTDMDKVSLRNNDELKKWFNEFGDKAYLESLKQNDLFEEFFSKYKKEE